MTLHTKRREPGRGYVEPRRRKAEAMVVARLPAEELDYYRQMAERRGVPLARVIREALRDFMLRGPTYEPPAP